MTNLNNVVDLYFLGSPQIRMGGVEVHEQIPEKAVALIAYLALSETLSVPRSKAASLLWSDMAEKRAKANLRNTLYETQKVLGDLLLSDRKSIALNRERLGRVDVLDFQTAFDGQTIPKEPAIVAYRGDFLGSLYFKDTPIFQEWALVERERLRLLAIEGMNRAVTAVLKQGDNERLTRLCRQLLLVDPLREGIHRLLMKALARQGQYNLALTQYQNCRQVLADELHLEPAQETESLAQRILEMRNRPRQNLPPPYTPFVGRTAEMAQLQEWLLDPDKRLITITGLGGAGKTRLARETAESNTEHFLEGAFYLSLTALQDGSQIPFALLSALNEAGWLAVKAGKEQPADLLKSHLRDWEMLVVVDNCEHLLSGMPFLNDLLNAAPGLKVLATSRERLNLRGEQLLPLEGLPYGQKGKTAVMPSRQLFVQRAKQSQPSFGVTDTNFNDINKICRLVEGLPLGLELAAAWVRVHGCRTIARELAADMTKLSEGEQDRPWRHRSLEATFDYSWQLLTGPEQETLAALSLFRGGFSGEAARVVAAASPAILKSLQDKALIRLAADHDRYEQHELLRQFAAAKLARDPEKMAVTWGKYGRYFATYLAEHGVTSKTFPVLRQDWINFQRAWNWALENTEVEILAQLEEPYYLLFIYGSRFQEGLEQFQMARKRLAALSSGTGDTRERLEAAVEMTIGDFHWRLGNLDRAEALINPLLSYYGQANEPDFVARTHGKLGLIAYYRSDFAKARIHWEANAAHCRKVDNISGLRQVLQNLALVVPTITKARAIFNETIDLSRQLQSEPGVARGQTLLSGVEYMTGNLTNALLLAQQAVDYYRAAEIDRWGLALALEHLATVKCRLGQFSETGNHIEEMANLYREMGNPRAEMVRRYHLGELYFHQREYKRAIDNLEHSRAAAMQLENEEGIQQTAVLLGDCYDQLTSFDKARKLYNISLEAGTQPIWSMGLLRLRAYEGLLRIDLQSGEFSKGSTQLNQMITETNNTAAFWLFVDRLKDISKTFPNQYPHLLSNELENTIADIKRRGNNP